MQNDKQTGAAAKYNNKTALEYAEMEGNTEAAQVVRTGMLRDQPRMKLNHTRICLLRCLSILRF